MVRKRGATGRSMEAGVVLASLGVLLPLSACGTQDEPRDVHLPIGVWPAASALDTGDLCADVADARVCWGGATEGECSAGTCVVPRPMPDRPPPSSGYRCSGMGSRRTCTDVRLSASRFQCDGDHCVQRSLRAPDDGDWECITLDGAVLCRGGLPPAGAVAGPSDSAFVCGAGVGGSEGLRVCIDFAPDFPDGDAMGWKCTVDHRQGKRRLCSRDERTARLGAACQAVDDCLLLAACVGGRCIPPRPAPSCWVDTDCSDGNRCAWGTCVEDAP